jgi:hypothetical protein
MILAGLLLGLARSARAEDAPTADDSKMAEARKQFAAGVNLLEDPDGAKYEDAYHAFHKAYQLSHSPKVLGNIGFCALHLERDGEAIDAYTAYLHEVADVDERERAQIQRDLGTLTSTVARVKATVKHAPGSLVLVDTRLATLGKAVDNVYPIEGRELAIRVRPGRHVFKVKASDGDSLPFEANIEPASAVTHDFTFPSKDRPVAPRSSPSYAGPIILGAVGLTVLGGAVASGIVARSKTNDIEKQCPNDLCPATYDLDGNKKRAQTFGTLADIGFIGGGVLVAGGFLWYLFLPKGESRTRAGATSPWTTTAGCTGSGCAFQLGRSF